MNLKPFERRIKILFIEKKKKYYWKKKVRYYRKNFFLKIERESRKKSKEKREIFEK